MRIILLLLVFVLGSCAPTSDSQPAAVEMPLEAADSLVLERGICFDSICPTYRLRVARSGQVHFHAQDPAFRDMVVTDTVSPESFDGLLQEARMAGMARLPERVADDQQLCATQVTGALTVKTTIYSGEQALHVVHYTGCRGGTAPYQSPPPLLAALRFYTVVDSVTAAHRWIMPL